MDEESNLKRQARRRLIGAVALATAVVVLLPMLLDSEPKPASQDIELRIPNKDKVGEFAPKMDLPPASLPAVTLPASSSVVAATVIAASQVAAAPEAVAATKVMESVSALAKATEDTSNGHGKEVIPGNGARQARSPHPSPDRTTSHSTTPASGQVAGYLPKGEGANDSLREPSVKAKPADPSQAGLQQSFIVQVGAYSKTDTAHYLQKKLSKEGFKAYTEKVADKTRVRVGPFAARELAEKARHKLEAQGLHPEIVALPQ